MLHRIHEFQERLPGRAPLFATVGTTLCVLILEVWAFSDGGPWVSWARGGTGMAVIQLTAALLLCSLTALLMKIWRWPGPLGDATTQAPAPSMLVRAWSLLSIGLFAALVVAVLLLSVSAVKSLLGAS